jgi:hypothetical protein
MKVGSLAWVIAITLAACSTGEVTAPAIQPGTGASLAGVAEPAAVRAPSADRPIPDAAVLRLDDLPRDGRAAPLPSDPDQLAGPVLPPEVVSVMTYDQFRLTLDSHGPGIHPFGSDPGDAVGLLGSASVVDDPAPPAKIEVE